MQGTVLVPVMAIISTEPTLGATLRVGWEAILGSLSSAIYCVFIAALVNPPSPYLTGSALFLYATVMGLTSLPAVFKKLGMASAVISLLLAFHFGKLDRDYSRFSLPFEVLMNVGLGSLAGFLASLLLAPLSSAHEVVVLMHRLTATLYSVRLTSIMCFSQNANLNSRDVELRQEKESERHLAVSQACSSAERM